MTINNTVNRNEFIGTGAVDTFPYTYRIFSQTDLLVTTRDLLNVETTLVVDVDYTVTGVKTVTGGTIVLTVDLPLDHILVIRRVRPLTQETDLKNQGQYFPETIEDSLDHIIMTIQELDNRLDGTMRLSETVDPTVVSTVLPIPESEKFIRWNTAADGLENASFALGSGISLPVTLGFMVQTSPNVFSARTLVPNEGLSGTDLDGVSGAPTFGITASGVTNPKLGNGVVDARTIAASGVPNEAIQNDAIDARTLAVSAVPNSAVQTNAIDARTIAVSGVGNLQMQTDSVDARVLAPNSVSGVHLAPGAITVSAMGAGSVVRVLQTQTTIGDVAGPTVVVSGVFVSGAVSLGDVIFVRGWFTTLTNATRSIVVRVLANGSIIANFSLAWQSNGIDEPGYFEARIAARSLTVLTSLGKAQRWPADLPQDAAPSQDLWSRRELAVADISANLLSIAVDVTWSAAPTATPSVKETNWTIDHVRSV